MVAAALNPASVQSRYFYVWMAAACALIAFGAFAPTYWLQLAPGTVVGPPLLHLHAALFSAWTILLLSQTALVANGRLSAHRTWGVAGVSLATAMVVVGAAAAIHALNDGLAAGYGDRSRAFSIVPLSALFTFALFFAAAIANVARPEVHKRLILLATVSLLQAAMARVFFVLITGGGPGRRPDLGEPPPLFVSVPPALVVDLLIVVGMLYDWRTRGRPHPAYLIGGGLLLAVEFARIPLATTPAWLGLASYLAGFAK